MDINPFLLLPKHMLLVALSFLLWICSGIVTGARDSPISLSTPQLGTRSVSGSQGLLLAELAPDDTIPLAARDISPAMLATAVPVSSHTYEKERQRHPENKQLHLRSSSRKVSGIAGYTIYSLPIVVSELAALLSDARIDLQKHDINCETPFYQFNTTKWSFSVFTANRSLHCTYIEAVISHFTKLSPISFSPAGITSTRVGVVLNGSLPIADIIIMPCCSTPNSSYIPFSSFGVRSNSSSTQPTEIITITPSGGSCSYQPVNETAALAPFSTPQNHKKQPLLQPRFIEPELLAHVSQTLFAISMRLWRRPDGLPIEVKVWAATAVVTIGVIQLNLAALKELFVAEFWGDLGMEKLIDGMSILDTGFFVVGRLYGRLVMELTRRDSLGRLLVLPIKIWLGVINLLLAPLQGMNLIADTWGFEGDILGPEDGIGGRNGSEINIGRWELYFGAMME